MENENGGEPREDVKDQDETGEAHAADGKATQASGKRQDTAGKRQDTAGKRQDTAGSSPRTVALLLAALVVGGAGGWFAKEAHAKTARATAAGGSCEAWEQEICSGAGEQALACLEAKAASGLLPAAACDSALDAVPDTLAKVAAAREVCNSLVTKLCTDLGTDSPTCGMVREKTELFPPERCQEMLDNYDEVAGQLRMMQEQMGGHPSMGAPPGASPQPAPPGASPQPAPSGATPPPGAVPVPPQ